MNSEFKTTHNLPFEIAKWEVGEELRSGFTRFRIGTCTGLWCSTDATYDILAIDNSDKGNGHFKDVLEWFHNSCKRDKKNFRILEVWNRKFKNHLMAKQGFIPEGKDNLIRGYKWNQQ